MKTAKIGTISHGTLRTEDLLSTFISELESLMLINGNYFAQPLNRSHRDRLTRMIGDAQDCFDENGEDISDEEKQQIALDLVSLEMPDALNEFAPPYCYFGAHPGDGSDFGFWPMEIEDVKEQVEFVSDEDDEYPFAGYRGEWLHINERGNCTLYVRGEDGKDVEIWSLV